MNARVDCVISSVRVPISQLQPGSGALIRFPKVREYHRKWKEESQGTRDVVIIAHGHFNRCLIARWVGLPLSEGV
jgi:hypothetical protein